MDMNATLPEELILQIVVRLPVKSVGRCRCVSTRWRSLFSDPQFAKSHFQVSPKHQSLIFRLVNCELKTLGFDLSDTASFEKESLVLRDLKPPFDHTCLGFLGSCNGLVAARDFSNYCKFGWKEEGLFIWNPSTGFFKKLPSRRFPTRLGVFRDDIIVGFGCVSGSDEYKLVMGAEIYSSKTNSWSQIEMPGGNFGIGMSVGVLCSGALHWPAFRDDYGGPQLYAFDLETEEFSVMELPSALQTQWGNILYNVSVTCEGCLFVLAHSREQDCDFAVEFWVMREYGNSDSWTRSFSVKIPTQPDWRDRPTRLEAISVMETSALVRKVYPEKHENLMSTTYYRNEEQNTGIYMIQCGLSLENQMVVYKESLCCLSLYETN